MNNDEVKLLCFAMDIQYDSLTVGVTKWASLILFCESHNRKNDLLQLICPEEEETPAPTYNPNTPRSRSGGTSIVANNITASNIVTGDSVTIINNGGGGRGGFDPSSLAGLGDTIQRAVQQATRSAAQVSSQAAGDMSASIRGSYTAGGPLVLTGSVGEDLDMGGFQLTIQGGSVGGDVNGASELVFISGRIGGDANVDGRVTIDNGAIQGDLNAGDLVMSNGRIGGSLNAASLTMTNGSINSDVSVTGALIMSGGRIGGDVNCNQFNQTGGRVNGDVSAAKVISAVSVGGDIN